ncbi:GntR family transcriptional regulator [Pedobacter sp. MC2016-24]|uniref:GntR family transcriptional regulator n=1 Tax=Pedobacter sp. MC2016-24 TaxID=2780090 RepID=UPI0018818E45|nr:GntR family transcriptional regulator [Pedobacter sp. MC2016-24]MBE9600104.1 GntR family transcriptional regulator [Pedobacter sp. MC2016-24]
MKYQLFIDPNDKTTKAKQIVQAIIRDIEKGILQKNSRVPSINDFSSDHKIARDTVEKAYKRLKDQGYLISVPGKGNYVAEGPGKELRILMVLNKMSSYKKEVYDTFIQTLGKKAKVELQIHHYDPKLFKEIIENNKGKYHYYAVMPHFFHDAKAAEYEEVLKSISPHELVLLDKNVPLKKDGYISVYQDFKQDSYDALQAAAAQFDKYSRITVVFPKLSHHPVEILYGIQLFCEEHDKQFLVVSEVDEVVIQKGEAFIILTEPELADLIKKIRSTGLKQGVDIGILSFNETVMKELLEITVVTTDFKAMGELAANMILQKEFKEVRNNFRFIQRQSL